MFYIITSRIPLISHDNTNRKYFKLFVLGSAIYVVVHYYLYKELRAGFIEKIKKFLYHVMVIDFIIASVLLKYLKIANPEEENEDVVTDKKQPQHQSNESDDRARNTRLNGLNAELEEQRRLFLEQHQQRLLEQRVLEQNRLRLLEQKRELDEKNQKAEKEKSEEKVKSDKHKKETKTEKKKSKEVNSDSKSSKSSKSSSSSSSSSSESSSKKSEKSKEKESETSESPKPKKSDKKKEKREDNGTESELPLYQ